MKRQTSLNRDQINGKINDARRLSVDRLAVVRLFKEKTQTFPIGTDLRKYAYDIIMNPPYK